MAPCLHINPTQVLRVPTAFWKMSLSGQCIKPASLPRFGWYFFLFESKRQKNVHLSALGKKARQKLPAVPLSYVMEKLTMLLKRCFPEHLQLKLQPWRYEVAMRVFFHMDLKSLSTFAYLPSSHPHLQPTSSPSETGNVPVPHTTDSPCSVALWCLHRSCLELSFWRSQAVSMLYSCVPKTGCP